MKKEFLFVLILNVEIQLFQILCIFSFLSYLNISCRMEYAKTQKTRFKDKKAYFNKVINELVLTLNSRAKPYSDVNELMQHFA